MRRIIDLLKGVGLIIIFWYILAIVIHHPVIPLPHSVIYQFMLLLTTKELYVHLLSSFNRVFIGSLIAIIIGLPLGIISGKSKKADAIISPILYLLYPLPKIAFFTRFYGVTRDWKSFKNCIDCDHHPLSNSGID